MRNASTQPLANWKTAATCCAHQKLHIFSTAEATQTHTHTQQENIFIKNSATLPRPRYDAGRCVSSIHHAYTYAIFLRYSWARWCVLQPSMNAHIQKSFITKINYLKFVCLVTSAICDQNSLLSQSQNIGWTAMLAHEHITAYLIVMLPLALRARAFFPSTISEQKDFILNTWLLIPIKCIVYKYKIPKTKRKKATKLNRLAQTENDIDGTKYKIHEKGRRCTWRNVEAIIPSPYCVCMCAQVCTLHMVFLPCQVAC